MRLFGKIQRKRMGITRSSVLIVLTELEKVAPIDEEVTEILAMEVWDVLESSNQEEWCKASDAGFDWDKLLDFLMMVIEKLIPLIVKSRAPIPVYTYTA